MLISPSEIIVQSFKFYKNNWRHLIPYMVLSFLPTIILECLGIMGIYIYALIPSLTITHEIVILLVLAATFVFDIWISVAFTRAAKTLLQNEPGGDSWQTLFNNSSQTIWPAFYTSMLTALAVLLGLILFVVPGVIFTIWYGFAFNAVALENKSGMAALSYSKQLVVGRWWPIFIRLISPIIIFLIIGAILRYALVDPIALLPYNQFSILVVQSILATIINVLMMPLFYGSGVLLFLSAKANLLETPPKV